MQSPATPVYARDHTILGVCEAIGEDFGFNPILVRLPLALCLLFAPLQVIAVYAGLGLVVAFSRIVAPNPRPAALPDARAEAPAPASAGENDDRDLAMAA
ncbi:MAG TPA: PspC domain-containing protein [Allosphingosinicella sp.]|jgi:phage shock protein PspC (stress-responsive transcriptional regulator)|nr:PspC domain-containing protein [Allosphingosinicella sp.]